MAKKVSFTLPTPTKPQPAVGDVYYAFNLDRSVPKLNSLRILSRVWADSEVDKIRYSYSNVFTTLKAAKNARKAILAALAGN